MIQHATSAQDDASVGDVHAFRVRIAGSANEYACAPDDVLLRAALRAGLGFPHECNVGGCGNCRFELVDGEIDTLWADAPGLSPRDRERGRHLACQSRPRSDCTIKLRLLPAYEPQILPRRTDAVLLSRREVTHDMLEFAFVLDDGIDFLPGQYALLTLPGVDGARAYSMSNLPNPQREWQFIVRRQSGGHGSAALFDGLAAGDRIGIDGPYGAAFLRTDSPRDVVCIAGGSGLAPMLSIARGMLAAGMLRDRALHFFFGGRRPVDIAGQAELAALIEVGANVHFHAAVSQPDAADGTWQGRVGLIHDHVVDVLGDRLAASEVYFAGPAPMAQAVLAMLAQAGVPPTQMHFDRYF